MGSQAMSGLDVTAGQWSIIRSILQKYLQDQEIWAFGSRVTGKAKPYSDLDIVVVSEKPLSPELEADLIDAFRESDLPWKVDVLEWSKTGEQFRKIIKSKHLIIWPEGTVRLPHL